MQMGSQLGLQRVMVMMGWQIHTMCFDVSIQAQHEYSLDRR